MANSALITVVDDDESVRDSLEDLIRSFGLSVKTFASAKEFLNSDHPHDTDCLVLDVQLPGLSGLELQQELAKADVQIPIIFLTGHGDIPMTVRAVKAGALAFLTKPFDPEDLLAAIRQGIVRSPAARRQRHRLTSRKTNMKEFHPFRLDTVNQCLWRDGDGAEEQRILLTPRAFSMLRYLVEHAGRLVTQDELLEALWSGTYVQPDVLKSHICDIRVALGDDPRKPRFIETLPRRGYRFLAVVSEGLGDTHLQADAQDDRLVGRNAELDWLRESLQRAVHGERQFLFVTGEPGVGKTALADEFQRMAVRDHSGLRIARGQCVEGHGGKEPYYPVLEALGQLCRGPAADFVVQVLAAQAPSWLVQFPALVKREYREKLQVEIVGATRERMLREMADAMEKITVENPILLVLEDLQWLDPSTVDLISVLARRRQPARLLLLGTYQPVELLLANHPLKGLKQDLLVRHLCDEIALESLREADIAEFIAAELPEASVPAGLAGLVFRHSEGNPLFMSAILEGMAEQKLLIREDGDWKLTRPLEEIEVQAPDGLRQMIELQIERLSGQEQRVLEVMSVTTTSPMSVKVGSMLADFEPEVYEELIEGLARRHQLVRSAGVRNYRTGPSLCYEFVHVLCREVVYSKIPPSRRRNLQASMMEIAEAQDALAIRSAEGGDWRRAG